MTDTSTTGTETGEHQPELKRVLGPRLLLLFIVGDILGTGIYAITGSVAKEVGGAVWLPFLVAFVVATLTAFSYLELVTKYPQAAGAALYVHKAFGVHFFTFLVCFTVMCSGITSAATASRAFAANLEAMVNVVRADWLGMAEVDASAGLTTFLAICFIALVALVNLRGVAESVYANVVLTCVELSGLLLVIMIGIFAIGQGKADLGRVVMFDTAEDKGIFLAVTAGTTLAFFAMVGFEDSVNMAEEVKNPSEIFPKIMLTGLGITGLIYVLVSISAVALVSPGELGEGEAPLLKVVQAGAPNLPVDQIFPLISMFAVANSALINMLMASRLLYGMAKQRVLPPVLGKVLPGRRTPWVAILFTTVLATGLLIFAGGRQPARRHHGAAAAGRLLGRQHHLPGAAQGPQVAQALRGPDRDPDHRRSVLRVPGRPVDRSQPGAVPDRRRADRRRHRAVVDHLADQPGHLRAQDLPEGPERPGRRRPQLTAGGGRLWPFSTGSPGLRTRFRGRRRRRCAPGGPPAGDSLRR